MLRGALYMIIRKKISFLNCILEEWIFTVIEIASGSKKNPRL